MMTCLWKKAGGKCFEGTRLIAAKWSPVWERFGANFPQGYGTPHPPYALSSCANWRQIGPDEAIVLGVISERDLRDHRSPETDEERREREAWIAKIPPKELADFLRERGTRAERYAEEKRERAEKSVEMARVYAEQCREREAVDAMFVRMSRMDEIFALKQASRPEPPGVLMAELQELMRTPVFDRYPHWKARAIRYAGVLLEEQGRFAEALEYYLSALDWNPALLLKRKIAALKKATGK